MFKTALRSSVIRLRVIRRLRTQTAAQSGSSTNATDDVKNLQSCPQSTEPGVTGPSDSDTGDQNAATPVVIKIPPAVPRRSSSTSLSTAKNKFTQISSTRLIGKVMDIELTKGDDNDDNVTFLPPPLRVAKDPPHTVTPMTHHVGLAVCVFLPCVKHICFLQCFAWADLGILH